MRLLVVALAAAITLAGCGSDTPEGVSGRAIKPISSRSLPDALLGMELTEEDVSNNVEEQRNTYVRRVSLFSLRRDNQVQATLQVSELSDAFNYKSGRAKSSLADKIGGARAQRFRLGSDTVYVTQGLRQRIAIWFRENKLFVLSSRQDFPQPRTLLREALEIDV